MPERAQTAGDLVRILFADLVGQVDELASAAAADEPDAVHQLRTVVRRLRNVLAAFDRFLVRSEDAALRDRLRDCGDRLGAARDLEVRIAHLESLSARCGLIAAAAPVLESLHDQHARAHTEWVAWWDGADGRTLRSVLAAWVTAPPLDPKARQSATKAARRTVRRQAGRTLKASHRTHDLESAHALRKAARRLRHTCDAVASSRSAPLDGSVLRLGAASHQVQSILGDHRDARLLSVLLADSGADPRLAAAAERRADEALLRLPQALADLSVAADSV